jgi:Relaxase/Mobilisation nuclease domain.
MAVIKAVSSKAGIGQALDYVTKEEKTEDKLVSGLHCEPDTVKDEMQATKELWGKTGGRTYKHFVQSYHEDEHITPEQAHKNAVELAKNTEAWKGHEVLIATHIDRGHIHTHFIVNSVNYENGHKLQWSKADLQNLKDRCNEQSRQQGLHVPEKGKTFSGEEREETVAWNKETYNLLKQAEKGEVKSYVQDIALSVMDCRETARSREDFIKQMNERGYGVDWQDSHKYITFTDLERQSQGEKQCKVRNNKLEKYYAVDFGKESLEHGFEINARREAERTATTERARQQLDRTAVAENSGADERARARQLLDRTAVAEDSRTGKAYQPDNTAVTEERLSNLRSYQPSRGMESQGRPGTDQGKDQERKLLAEQLNLKKTLQKKGLQASEAISQAEEWKNQAEKSEIQIQKLLSEKQELVSTVAEQGKRIAEQTEQIEKLNEADNVLKLNAELKKQNEKLKQDKLNAEQEAEATVSSVKKEYAAKGRELDRRIGEAAKQSAELKEERASINQDVERRATAMYQSRKKELDSKFKAQSLSYDGFVLGLLLYGVLTTVFTAIRSEQFVSDFKAFFIAIGQFLVNAFQLLLKGGQWASQLGDKIPQPVVATIVHYLLLIVFVGGIGIGVGVLIFLGASKVFEFYTDDYADTLSLAVFLISLAVSVYFAEPIRAAIPINLLLLLILVHIVYVLIRWYVKGCKRSRGYY